MVPGWVRQAGGGCTMVSKNELQEAFRAETQPAASLIPVTPVTPSVVEQLSAVTLSQVGTSP
jgi:hypothetical protein